MTDVETSAEAKAPAEPSGPTAGSWFLAVGGVVLLVLLSAPLGMYGLYAVGFFAAAGFIYGVFGMTLIGIRWFTIPRGARRSKPETLNEVHKFRTGVQRFTLSLNLLLLILLAIGAVETVVAGLPLSAMWLGGILQIGALALVVVNIPGAWSRTYILGEQEAMTHHVGSYRLIAANRVFSYLVWASGTILGGALTLPLLWSLF